MKPESIFTAEDAEKFEFLYKDNDEKWVLRITTIEGCLKIAMTVLINGIDPITYN